MCFLYKALEKSALMASFVMRGSYTVSVSLQDIAGNNIINTNHN